MTTIWMLVSSAKVPVLKKHIILFSAKKVLFQISTLHNHFNLFPHTDVNECETVLCGPNADCINTFGSYNCQCRQGFEGNGFNCTGIK